MPAHRILVIDDEDKIREVLRSYLEHAGFLVVEAGSGRAGLAAWAEHQPALVVLDLMLPDINGEEVCRNIRRASNVPILMLTAKVDEPSLLQGFNIGADDYLTKPFSPKEMLARVQALLRRGRPAGPPDRGSLQAAAAPMGGGEAALASPDGALRLDSENHRFSRDGQELNLTATEFRLMEAFLRHPERAFSRADLVRIALGEDFSGNERTVDAHIKNLRQKLERDASQPGWIHTVHGFGYRLGKP